MRSPVAAPAWLEETFVWGQVNVNERDPETFDVDSWADYWASCRLQGITLNVGGPLAYYPTDVQLHPRSRYLGGRDLLGETVAAAKRQGLRVLGRLDPTFVPDDVSSGHPDWCMTRSDGEPFTWSSLTAAYLGRPPTTGGKREAQLACSHSPYLDELVLPVATEVLTRYDLDGIWTNGWPMGLSTPRIACHCPHCLQAWDDAHPGRARPVEADPADPEWRDYYDFESARLEALQRRFRDHVHAIRPGVAFVSSAAARLDTSVRWGRFIDGVDALGVDAQGRPEFVTDPPRPPTLWAAGLQSELTRAVAQGKPVIRFIGTYATDTPVLRHGAKPPHELRLQMAQALAHGDRPKWHTLGGTSYDRRWMEPTQELDAWMATHDDWLHGLEPLSDIGVLWSPRSVLLDRWRGSSRPVTQ